MDDPVVVTDREFAFAKLDVPLDAMEQFLKRLHTAIVDWIALASAAFGSGSSDETDRESPRPADSAAGSLQSVSRLASPLLQSVSSPSPLTTATQWLGRHASINGP